jgi:hypothetical protein
MGINLILPKSGFQPQKLRHDHSKQRGVTVQNEGLNSKLSMGESSS